MQQTLYAIQLDVRQRLTISFQGLGVAFLLLYEAVSKCATAHFNYNAYWGQTGAHQSRSRQMKSNNGLYEFRLMDEVALYGQLCTI